MTNIKKIALLSVTIIACIILSVISISAENAADFTMENGYLNVKARDILAIEGAFTYDESKYVRNANKVIDTNKTDNEYDGQFFFHEGAGDTFVFTVDFGSFKADKFSFMHYGGAVEPTVFKLYANNKELGEGISTGGNGWLDNWGGYAGCHQDEIIFSEPITGVQTIKIEIISSAPAWPANNIGYFEFFDSTKYDPNSDASITPLFTMTEDSLLLSANKILGTRGAITRDPELFVTDHAIGTNSAPEQPEYDGNFFIHSGAGDTFTFYVDLGEKIVDSMSYMDYGLGGIPSIFEIYADDELIGEGEALGGNGWELSDYEVANYNEVYFNKEITGLVKITIVIVESDAAWPANNIGMYTLYEKMGESQATPVPQATQLPTTAPTQAPTEAPTESPTEVPENKNDGCGSASGIAQIMLILGAALIIKKKK